MTQSLNSNISSLVTACNNVNVQASLGFTPLVVEPFVAGQLFADNPNSNAINPVVQQIVSFLNQITYISKPDVTQVATTLDITPAQLNNNFNNPYNPPNPDLNNNIKKTLYAPSALSGTVSGLTVNLSWTSNSKNQTGYHVYRSTDNINFSIINSPTGTTYNDTTPNAATYYYKVSAYNAYGESAMSNTINETTTNPNTFYSLFHFDTDFNNVNPQGDFSTSNAIISSSDYKFGGASCYMDPSSYSITASGSNSIIGALASSGGGFDCWVKTLHNDGSNYRLLTCSTNDTGNGWSLSIASNDVYFHSMPTQGNSYIMPTGLSIYNTWTHIEVSCASDGTTRMFVNGILSGTPVANNCFNTSGSNSLIIGNTLGNGSFGGYLDELRFFDVTQAHTSNFTPPTAPY